MQGRIIFFFMLIVAVTFSGRLVNKIMESEMGQNVTLYPDPDYYMQNFTTVTMGSDGLPINKLYAVYMEHNPINNTSELYEPKLEIYRDNKGPFYITADKGWATEDNEVILLRGKVTIWEKNIYGNITMNIETTDLNVLLVEEYAETNQSATIVTNKTTVIGKGIRAHFDNSFLEILNHEQTIIARPDKI